MKKLVLLTMLLGLAGCSNVGRPHQIVCTDSKTKALSVIVDTPGDVVALVAQGQSVLAYYDKDHKTMLIKLRDNDCVIY